VERCVIEAGKDRTVAGYPHPRVFFVRVANKGVRLDAARKSGKYRT